MSSLLYIIIIQVPHTSLFLLIYDLCVFYLLDQRSLILILLLTSDWKCSVGYIQTGHIDFIPPQICRRLQWGVRFFTYTFHHQLIECFQGNHLKVFLLSYDMRYFCSGRAIQSKPSMVVKCLWYNKVVGTKFVRRVTKTHWDNPSQLFSVTLRWL